MSNPKQNSKDIFTATKKNVDKFFAEVENSSPKYHQTVEKLQKDYIDAWKTVINSAISLEQEYATKAGLNMDVPESTLKTIRDITDESIKAYAAQNKMSIDTAKATKQAFDMFNENTKSFAGLNREIMGYNISVFQPKSRT